MGKTSGNRMGHAHHGGSVNRRAIEKVKQRAVLVEIGY